MNQYETIFVMTPVLSDDQLKETVNDYKTLLKEKGAKIVNEDNWGLKKLAYPIQKKSTGFYHLFQFEAPGTAIAALELAYGRDERLLRFITVKLDKHAIAFNAQSRKNRKTSKS
jgi:small subunit ribosomal protein S6|tara:strand:+ start:55 stop:396 length:342 start_codon:yes stop_codon:yes gene_type:complete